MPRLAETFFTLLLPATGTVGPKFLQFSAGLVTTFLTYKITRRFLAKTPSLLASLLFYNTWLVSWQSGSAYVDLIRTSLELAALYFLTKKQSFSNISLAGCFLGLAIGVKWHALGTLALAALLYSPLILFPAFLFALPWLTIAFHFTGNPLYPLLEPFMTSTQLAQVSDSFHSLPSILIRFLLTPLYLTFPPEKNFLNPLLGLLFPLGLALTIKKNLLPRRLVLYTLGGIALWLLTPPPSPRYLLPYLPFVTLVSIQSLKLTSKKVLDTGIVSTSFLITSLRLAANFKYLPVITGKQTTNTFLTTQAHRLPDTFIDSDGWVEDNLPPDTLVLTDLHSLYYLPVNFDHLSWADPHYPYPYLITANKDPNDILGNLIHTNSVGIQIFSK